MDKSPQIFLNIYEPPPHSRYQKGDTKLSSTLWTHNFVVTCEPHPTFISGLLWAFEHIFVCTENCSNYDENIRWNCTQFSHSDNQVPGLSAPLDKGAAKKSVLHCGA